ncbi:MAG: glycerophosphodiester phosphodiesterase family protein [Candidatus Babeliales bacterium]|jgi:glycerophosphoryl diester phosphodiesterase
MIIAHRGASGYVPENTADAFKKAIDLKVDAVEFDVYKCKSSDLIVMHDASVDRTTDGKGLIKNKTLEELKALHVKGGGTIPTFSEVLDVLDAKTTIVIDIKEEGVANNLAEIITTYVHNKGWTPDQFYATGFQHEELKKLGDLVPFVKLIPSVICTPYKKAAFAQEMKAYGVCLINIENCFSESLAKDIKARGLQLWVWSPSESPETIATLYNLGADAIMVDYPDVVKEIWTEVAKQNKIKQAAFAQRMQSNLHV